MFILVTIIAFCVLGYFVLTSTTPQHVPHEPIHQNLYHDSRRFRLNTIYEVDEYDNIDNIV